MSDKGKSLEGTAEAWELFSGLPREEDDIFPIKKKGHEEEVDLPTTPQEIAERSFIRDRETGQLFVVTGLSGGNKNDLGKIADPEYKNKKDLELYYVAMPLFTKRAAVTVAPVFTPHNFDLLGLDEQFNIATEMSVTYCNPYATTPLNYGGRSAMPQYLYVDNALSGQYCAVENYEALNTTLNNTATGESSIAFKTLNPLVVPYRELESNNNYLTYSGALGNFIYGNAACSLSKDRIIIADINGLFSARIENYNQLSEFQLEIPASGWCPLSLSIVYDEAAPAERAYLYMTAVLNVYTLAPYVMNPGYAVSNFHGGEAYSHGTNLYQNTKNFVGHIVVFKFEVSSGEIRKDNYSIVYSTFGYYADNDFSNEENRWVQGVYGTYSCDQKIYDDNHLHSVYIVKADGAEKPARQVDLAIPMDSFVFGVDSLFYQKEKGWQQGLWFKKEENPFIAVYGEDGNLLRTILILGKNYPINAKRVRFVGTSVMAPLAKLREELVSRPTTNGVTKYDCAMLKCKFMRGQETIKQYGYPTITPEGDLYLLKAWDCHPHITAYQYNRPLFYPRGGTSDLGSCDMRDSCGEVSYCYTSAITMSSVCRPLNTSFEITAGYMKLGLRMEIKYWIRFCCGTGFGMDYTGAGFGLGGTATSTGPDCQDNLYRTSAGSIIREYYPKTDKYFYVDSLTHQTALFDVNTVFIPGHRKVPDAYYEELIDPKNSKVGKIFSDLRRFGFWAGPTLLATRPNPVLEVTETGVKATFYAVDIFRLQTMMEFIVNYTDYRHEDQKEVSISPNIDFSAYYYAKIRGFTLIALLDNSYITEGTDLRTFTDSPSPMFNVNPYSGTYLEVDTWTTSHNLTYMSSLDWALYPLAGSHNFFPLDRTKYQGAANLSGALIYEGYSIDPDGSVVSTVDGLEPYYGGKNQLNISSALVKINRSCTFMFSLRAQTNKCSGTNQVLHYPDPQFTFEGEINEDYLVIRE